jgi:hypothetical protein
MVMERRFEGDYTVIKLVREAIALAALADII